jgi:hypothetical protein
MRAIGFLPLLFVAVFFCACASSRTNQMTAPGPEASEAGTRGAAVKTMLDKESLEKKIKRYVKIPIPFDKSRFDERGLAAVKNLVLASRVMDDLFWEQASEIGPVLRDRLSEPANEKERLLAHYLSINYGPYDRLDDMKAFLDVPKRIPGATFYPEDMTKEEFKQWVTDHPQDKEDFENWFTVIRRTDKGLRAIPYSEHYRGKLQEASRLLHRAAGEVDNESLAKFLNSRADAFLSNQYTQSDMDWMDVTDSDLEATIGPYEVYEDHLLNYKAAFESFITLRDPVESKKLSTVASYLTQMEKNLPIPDEHKNFERGQMSPIVVADLIYSAGDTRAGVQTLAFNLPNDEKVREAKGSKKVMLKNISHAKFAKILTPISARVLSEDQLSLVSFDAYFNHTLMHEVSHGLGPGRIEHEGKKVAVNLLLGELYSTIEEAKADVLGVYNSLFLVSKGELAESMQNQTLVTFLAGVFRSVRFGVHEAHGRANLLAFNFLEEKGAYRFDPERKRYSVDLVKAPGAVRELARHLLMLQATGDYPGTKAFIDKYAQMSKPMKDLLDSLHDIPVDIEPVFEVESALGL